MNLGTTATRMRQRYRTSGPTGALPNIPYNELVDFETQVEQPLFLDTARRFVDDVRTPIERSAVRPDNDGSDPLRAGLLPDAFDTWHRYWEE